MPKPYSPYPLYAFSVLESALLNTNSSRKLNDFKAILRYTKEDPASPIFVTWKITNPKRNQNNDLRGCIGTFDAMELELGVAEYSLVAAMEDTRFHKIGMKDLKYLSVDVTLLQNFENVENALDWELGKHGIRIKFEKNRKIYSATFLPEVATEQGWNKEETLRHLIAKSGYLQRLDFNELKLTRYQGIKSGVTFQEYEEFCREHFGNNSQ